MASGSEVELIVEAGYSLVAQGINVRLVSFPSWYMFEQQDAIYRDEVLPPSIKARIAVEAGISQGWERYIGESGRMIGVNHFGASAPYKKIYEEFGLTAADIVQKARIILGLDTRI